MPTEDNNKFQSRITDLCRCLISNTFSSSVYKSFGEDMYQPKFISSINSIDDEDVRLSKRKTSSKD